MKTLKEILIRELGGIGGSGVQTKDGHGPYSGHLDPDYDELRDALTEIPARTSPTHNQMVRPQDRPTGVGGRTPTGTADFDPEAIGTAGSAFLPPGVRPEDFDAPPEDFQKPIKPLPVPGSAGPGLSRQRATRQTMDPTKMLTPAELQQAKKQLGLEGNLPSLRQVEAGKYHHDVRVVLNVLDQAKKEGWIDQILLAVPQLQQLTIGKRPNDVEKAFELSFKELAKLVPRD